MAWYRYVPARGELYQRTAVVARKRVGIAGAGTQIRQLTFIDLRKAAARLPAASHQPQTAAVKQGLQFRITIQFTQRLG